MPTSMDLPATTTAILMGPWRPNRPQRGRGARDGRPLPAPSRRDARGFLRSRSVVPRDGARARWRECGGCVAALHTAGGGHRNTYTHLVLSEAEGLLAAAGAAVQRPTTELQ